MDHLMDSRPGLTGLTGHSLPICPLQKQRNNTETHHWTNAKIATDRAATTVPVLEEEGGCWAHSLNPESPKLPSLAERGYKQLQVPPPGFPAEVGHLCLDLPLKTVFTACISASLPTTSPSTLLATAMPSMCARSVFDINS